MKIARVETFLFDPGTAKNLLFCRVETEGGLHGWGEAYVTPGKEPVIEHLLCELAKYMIGRDAFNIRHTAQVVFDDFAMRRASLDLMSAWSAIEIALWDIVAKQAKLPLYNLLGGASRERVRVYANGWSSGTESIEKNIERALAVKELGYTALKWDPFPGPWRNFIHREDEDHVVTLRPPDARNPRPRLQLVSRGASPPRTRCMPSALAGASQNMTLAGSKSPASATTSSWSPRCGERCPIPVVTGEAIYSKGGFRPSRLRRATRPTSSTLTSATAAASSAMLDIAAMAQPQAVAIAPHNYNSPLVGLAATVQLVGHDPEFLDR